MVDENNRNLEYLIVREIDGNFEFYEVEDEHLVDSNDELPEYLTYTHKVDTVRDISSSTFKMFQRIHNYILRNRPEIMDGIIDITDPIEYAMVLYEYNKQLEDPQQEIGHPKILRFREYLEMISNPKNNFSEREFMTVVPEQTKRTIETENKGKYYLVDTENREIYSIYNGSIEELLESQHASGRQTNNKGGCMGTWFRSALATAASFLVPYAAANTLATARLDTQYNQTYENIRNYMLNMAPVTFGLIGAALLIPILFNWKNIQKDYVKWGFPAVAAAIGSYLGAQG
ncbi:MAG: hypothetical protein KKF44_11625 [Nanoarchaeota archaeon]|nr:hypothetical protein [Nanoarchaeota archaeon]